MVQPRSRASCGAHVADGSRTTGRMVGDGLTGQSLSRVLPGGRRGANRSGAGDWGEEGESALGGREGVRHMRIAPLADVKARFSEYVAGCRKGPVIVTKNGRPAAVLVAVPRDDAELERLVLAHTPRFRGLLEAARAADRRGPGPVPLAVLEADIRRAAAHQELTIPCPVLVDGADERRLQRRDCQRRGRLGERASSSSDPACGRRTSRGVTPRPRASCAPHSTGWQIRNSRCVPPRVDPAPPLARG